MLVMRAFDLSVTVEVCMLAEECCDVSGLSGLFSGHSLILLWN
jgi:hypothetical protein